MNKDLKRWMDEIEERGRIRQERRVPFNPNSFSLGKYLKIYIFFLFLLSRLHPFLPSAVQPRYRTCLAWFDLHIAHLPSPHRTNTNLRYAHILGASYPRECPRILLLLSACTTLTNFSKLRLPVSIMNHMVEPLVCFFSLCGPCSKGQVIPNASPSYLSFLQSCWSP